MFTNHLVESTLRLHQAANICRGCVITGNALSTANQRNNLAIHLTADLTGNFNDGCGCNVTIMAQPLEEELCAVLDAQPLCWIK